ncbi:MAG: hypothetical protein AAGA01_14540, partial [Cyanobacteria bacterium P01_E01_bin.43]
MNQQTASPLEPDRRSPEPHADSQSASHSQSPASRTKPVPAWMTFFFTRQIFAILLCFLLLMGGLMGYFSMVKEGEKERHPSRYRLSAAGGGLRM